MKIKKLLLSSFIIVILSIFVVCISYAKELPIPLSPANSQNTKVMIRQKNENSQENVAVNKTTAVEQQNGKEIDTLNINPYSQVTLFSESNGERINDDIVIADMNAEEIENLKSNANIEFEIDQPIRKMSLDSLPSSFNMIKIPQAHERNVFGAGIKIAILDTGISSCNGEINISGGVSFVDGIESYNDDNGHGTAMAGIIAAQFNDYGLAGIAPQAEVYSVKILDSQGNGRYSYMIQGINWAIENGIDIICLSVGGNSYSKFLEETVNEALNNNVLIVAAAGNNAEENATYPAKFNSVLSVGSINSEGVISQFSNYGNDVDVLAPGENIESILYINDEPTPVSGTSASNAQVVGAAAALWSENNNYTAGQVAMVLGKGSENVNDKSKYGTINLINSLDVKEAVGELLLPDVNTNFEVDVENDFIEALAIDSYYESGSNDTMDTANRIYSDYNNYGTITSTSDVDFYKITFSSSRKVNFYLEMPTNCDYDMYIYNGNGTLVANGTESNKVTGQYFELVANYSVSVDTYYIQIVTYSGTSNSYYILRAKGTDVYTATTIGSNSTTNAAITSAGQKHYYKFYAKAGEKINATLSNLPKDYDMYLYDEGGSQVGSSTNGSTTSEIIGYYTNDVSKVGYYYIIIYAYSSSDYSSTKYKLDVTDVSFKDSYENSSNSNGTFLNNNTSYTAYHISNLVSPQVITANIHNVGDEDWYSFYAPSGNLKILLQDLPKDYDLYLVNFSDPSTIIAYSNMSNTASEDIYYRVTSPSLFYVKIVPFEEYFSEQNYKLTISFDEISLYYSANFQDNSFNFNWKTADNAESKLLYGLSSTNLNQYQQSTTPKTNHSLDVNNLNATTQYYVQAQSRVPSGGTAAATLTSNIGYIYSQDANEPNQDYTQATNIGLDTDKQGTIYDVNDYDFFRFYLDSPAYIEFSLTKPSEKNYITYLWDGYNGVYANATNKKVLLNEGTYYFYVGSSEYSGDYDASQLYTIRLIYQEYVYATKELHFGGDGIYAATGNYSKSFTDLTQTAAGTEFNIKRTYNSRDNYDNHLSRGWMFNFEGKIASLERKQLMSDGSIQTTTDNNYKLVRMPDSGTMLFKVSGTYSYTSEDSRNSLIKNTDGTHTLTLTNQTVYSFNSNGYLYKVTDKFGNVANITVNSSGKVTALTDIAQNSYIVAYNGSKVKSISDSYGRSVAYDYDSYGRLNKVTDSIGQITNYTYYTTSDSKNNYLKEIKDHNSALLESVDYYTDSTDTQKIKVVTNIYGASYGYTYDDVNAKTVITEQTSGVSNKRITEQSYDAKKYVKTNKDAENGTTTIEYYQYKDANNNDFNKYGEEKKVTDRNNNLTEYVRDTNTGNVVKIINPDLSFKEYGYDSKNNIIWEMDESGKFIRYIYDSNNVLLTAKAEYLRLLSTTESKPTFVESGAGANVSDYAVTRYAYYTNLTVKGLIFTVTDPNGGVIEYTYDSKFNLKTVKNPESTALNPIISSNDYNNMGLISKSTSPKGNIVEYQYNNNGQLTKQTGILSVGNEVTRTIYDMKGNKQAVVSPKQYNPANDTNITVGERYTYYPNRLVETKTDPENNITTYTYDYYGNVLTETTPNNSVFVYTYDKLNRLLTTSFKEAPTESIKLLDSNNYTIVNKQLLVTTSHYKNGAVYSQTKQTYNYYNNLVSEYNGNSEVNTTINTTYYPNGKVLSKSDANQNSIYYKYRSVDSGTKTVFDESWKPFKDSLYTYFKTVYDKNGNKMKEVTSVNGVALYSVPSNGLIYKDFTYYKDNKLKSETDNEGRKSIYYYDNDRNVNREEQYYTLSDFNTIVYENNHQGKPVSIKTYIRSDEFVNRDFTPYSGTYLETKSTYDKNGNLDTVTSPLNIVKTYGYDNNNRQTSVSEQGINEFSENATITTSQKYDFLDNIIEKTDAKGNVTKLIYNKKGLLVYSIDANNGVTFRHYDDLNRVTFEVSPANYTGTVSLTNSNLNIISDDITNLNNMNRKEYIYNALNRVTDEKDIYKDPLTSIWNTIIKSYGYDSNGNILTETDGMRYVTNKRYDKSNNLTKIIDPVTAERNLEYTILNEYDALSRKIKETNAKGYYKTYTYNNANKLLVTKALIDGSEKILEDNTYDKLDNLHTKTDGNNHTTVNTYNALNKLKTATTPSDETMPSNTTTFLYDAHGNIIKTTDSKGNIGKYSYDNQNRLLSETKTKSDGSESITTSTKYDVNGNKRFETDGNTNVLETTYTILNKPFEVKVSGSPKKTTSIYNKNGNLLLQTDFRGNTIENQYDPIGRLVKVKDAYNNTVQTLYYNNNHVQIKSLDAFLNETIFEYDKNNRQLSTKDPLNSITGKTYDNAGNVETIYDGKNNTTTYGYDELGRIKTVMQVVNGQNIITSYTYDTVGNLRTQTDGRQNTISYDYNVNNKIKTKKDATLEFESYTYDCLGNLNTKTDRSNVMTTYDYDSHNRLSITTVGGVIVANTYDDNNNLRTTSDGSEGIERTYDSLNRVLTKDQSQYGLIEYQYDVTSDVEQGELAEIATYPSNKTVKKVYDKIGRLARIYLNNVLECSYQYYIDGKLHKTNYLNGISVEYFYYTDGQLQRMLVTKGSNTLYNFNYEYDPAKNPTYKNEVVEKSYKYDELNRLVWEKDGREGSDGAYKNIFKYDSANNRSEQFTDDLTLFENQVNTTYSYDDFNRLNTLEDASTTHNFIYNTENYRVQKDNTRYAYEYDKPISEYNQSGEIAFNLFGTKLVLRDEGTRKLYYVFNSHGDVISLTDENGSEVATYQYNAFGNVINQTGNVDTPFKYAGYVYDSETRLYYLNARYYDPLVGRFLTEDTYLGNQSDPLSLNLYTYTLNNPLKYYDPTGHLVDGDFLSTEERAGRYTLYNGIQYNYTGSDVIALQKWLINNDWWDKADKKYKAENKGKSLQRPGVNGIAFGYFGSATEYVVNYYKDTIGIANTDSHKGDYKGVVGQTTWEHMGISTTLVIDSGGINTNSNDKNIYRNFARALNERYAGDAFIKFLFPVGESYGLDKTIGQAVETGYNMYTNRGGQVIVDYVIDSVAKNKQYARVILIGHSAGAQGVGDAGKVLTDKGIYVPQIIQIGAPSEPVSNTIVNKTLRVQVATDIVANFVNQSNINKIVGADIAIYGAIKNNNTSMPKTKILDIYVDPKDVTGGHSTYFNKGNIYGYDITDSDYYTDGYYNNIWATINSFWDLVK